MSGYSWACDCGKKFRDRGGYRRHVRSCPATTDPEAALLRQAEATTAPGSRVTRNLPRGWVGDLDQPSLPLGGIAPVVVKGRAS